MTTFLARFRGPLLLATLLLLAACGKKDDSGYGNEETPGGPTDAPAAPMQVSHILIGFKSRTGATKSREAALALAKELIADLQAGRRKFEDLVERFSDDWNSETGKANSGSMLDKNDKSLPPGTYVFRGPEMVPAFSEAARKTPVGQVDPEPVETQFGFHVIRRDK